MDIVCILGFYHYLCIIKRLHYKEMTQYIKIKGARVNNLKDVSIDIPRNKLIVVSGVSGSGKSSLAFDTLYAEGQRRYVESLSSYARQFLGRMSKPECDFITGLPSSHSYRTKGNKPQSTLYCRNKH